RHLWQLRRHDFREDKCEYRGLCERMNDHPHSSELASTEARAEFSLDRGDDKVAISPCTCEVWSASQHFCQVSVGKSVPLRDYEGMGGQSKPRAGLLAKPHRPSPDAFLATMTNP